MNTFYTSDFHFGHENIIGFVPRPFADLQAMHEALINNWNSVVTDEDLVYFLGDLAMGKLEETLPLAGQLNGRKILLAGNHDRCWYGRKKFRDWISAYENVGFEVNVMGPHDSVEHEIAGVPVLLSHFPYIGDSHTNDRYLAYRPVNKGKFLLHGHTHSLTKFDDLQIHVGCDAWNYFPVGEEQIAKYIRRTKED